jgi:hypothetical protein
VGPINNLPLATSDSNDALNPNARPRGNFAGGFGICTPELWQYLVEQYGLAGRAYTSCKELGLLLFVLLTPSFLSLHFIDDIKGPGYGELRDSIVNWRLI